jgi:hypothetical protein
MEDLHSYMNITKSPLDECLALYTITPEDLYFIHYTAPKAPASRFSKYEPSLDFRECASPQDGQI